MGLKLQARGPLLAHKPPTSSLRLDVNDELSMFVALVS